MSGFFSEEQMLEKTDRLQQNIFDKNMDVIGDYITEEGAACKFNDEAVTSVLSTVVSGVGLSAARLVAYACHSIKVDEAFDVIRDELIANIREFPAQEYFDSLKEQCEGCGGEHQ